MIRLQRVPQRSIEVDFVAVTPPFTRFGQDSIPLQLAQDPQNRTLGDPDFESEFTHADIGLAKEADDRMRVVGQKRPPMRIGPLEELPGRSLLSGGLPG